MFLIAGEAHPTSDVAVTLEKKFLFYWLYFFLFTFCWELLLSEAGLSQQVIRGSTLTVSVPFKLQLSFILQCKAYRGPVEFPL